MSATSIISFIPIFSRKWRLKLGLIICIVSRLFSIEALGQSGAIAYTYDSLNRLIEARYPDKVIRYTYDDAGNRTIEEILTVNPTPVLASMNPFNTVVGGAGFTLTINGTNFVSGVTVRWNGTDRPTTFVDSTKLTATITAIDVRAAGTATITAINPEVTAGPSAPLPFSINYPAPTINNITPSFIQSGNLSATITINGSNFVNGSIVKWNGIERPSSFISADQMTIDLTAADLAVPGVADITVVNPSPGGGPSNVSQFTISNCGVSLGSTSQSFTIAGGYGAVNFSASTPRCAWSATSDSPWITIFSGNSGIGSSATSFSVAPNTGNARTGTITIEGSVFTVTQESACSYSLSPQTQNFTLSGGSGSVTVTTTSGCDWMAASNDPWVTVTGGMNSSGNGQVDYMVAANTGAARAGTITIAGLTFNVTQDAFGYEADVAPRPDGSGTVVVSDWVQVGRFSVGLDTPAPGSEFQRADCAPRATLGDGQITVADWVQAGRYSVGLDPVTPAGGPTQLGAFAPARTGFSTIPRELRIATEGVELKEGTIEVPIDLIALGGESGLTFSLQYDPNVLEYAGVEAGRDVVAGSDLLVNDLYINEGKLGVGIRLRSGEALTLGEKNLIAIKFRVKINGNADVVIAFDEKPVRWGVSGSEGQTLLMQPVLPRAFFISGEKH